MVMGGEDFEREEMTGVCVYRRLRFYSPGSMVSCGDPCFSTILISIPEECRTPTSKQSRKQVPPATHTITSSLWVITRYPIP